MTYLALCVFIWITCGVLAYGIYVADSWHSFPSLHGEGEFRDISASAIIFGFLGPMGLFATFFSSGFARHGLLYRQPPQAENRSGRR